MRFTLRSYTPHEYNACTCVLTWTLFKYLHLTTESFDVVCGVVVQVSVAETTGSQWPTALQSDRCHQDGPLAGVCPYVLESSSSVDVGPVPLVVSPSLPAAVDLSVCHTDQLPLNLSVPASAAVHRLFQTVSDAVSQPGSSTCLQQLDDRYSEPPPAHCRVVGPGVLDSKLSTDALTRLQSQWTVCHPSTGCTPAVRAADVRFGDVRADEALRSLDVLSVAAALRSEMLDRRLVLSSAGADTVTSMSLVNSYQVRPTHHSSCHVVFLQ